LTAAGSGSSLIDEMSMQGPMRIDVDCRACGAAKRPLTSCPACGAVPADREADLRAWRERVAEHHRARLAQAPLRPAERSPIRCTGPLAVVVRLPLPGAAPAASVAPIVPVDEPATPADVRSFDWQERRRVPRLRRIA
jgi:hypothetical protein